VSTEHTNPIHVIFFADRGVLLGLHAALGSLIGHLTGQRPAKISVYYEDFSAKDILGLQETAKIAHFTGGSKGSVPTLHVEPVFALPHDGLRPHTGSLLPYCKLFVPILLAKKGRACILDCDILVEDDISALFDCPLEGKPIGCVIESILSCSPERNFWTAQGRVGHEVYYNTGVLLFDLERYWDANLLQITSEFLTTNKDACLLGDQTVFNAVLYPYVKALETRWNKVVFPRFKFSNTEPLGITHFAFSPKPFDLGGRLVSPNGRIFTNSLRNWTGLHWWPVSARYSAARLARAWNIRRRYIGLLRARFKEWLKTRWFL
jgi:lipopolysaccharide biosynthesis glycosyltransferase